MKVFDANRVMTREQLAAVVLAYVAFIQLFVILYLDYIGYAPISNLYFLLYRYFMSVGIAFIGGFIAGVLDLRVIAFLDIHLPWHKKASRRVPLQMAMILFIGVFVALILTFITNLIQPYPEHFFSAFINNIMISFLSNFMLMIILELWISLIEKKKSELKEQKLENEISSLKYDVLKSQIQPHFIFNSLNTMSGLISSDPVKAQNFFDELSQVYRYVLETIDCKSVRLSRELEFIESYRFLMNIRFTDSVIFHIHNSEDYLDWWLPPLSLQFAVENALKHNSASEISPLIIHIYCSDGAIFVVNNIQYKYSKEYSSGLGQNNINKRYALITKIEPEYFTDGGKYFSKFPLIPTKPIIKNNC